MSDKIKKVPLCEMFEGKLNISESKETSKRKGVLNTVKGIFAQYSKNEKDLNRNGRAYKKSLWEKVLHSDYYKEMIENQCLFGEADHPEDRMSIHLPDISHCITKLEIKDDGFVYGEADILDTPAGRIVNTVVEYGSKIGMSTRAEGSVRYEGNAEVVNEDDYRFHTVDFVPMPSVVRARQSLVESANSTDPGYENMKEMCADIEKQISEMSITDLLSIKKIIEYLPNKESINKIIEKRLQSTGEQNTYSALEEAHFRLFEAEKSLEEVMSELNCSKQEVASLSQRIEELRTEVADILAQRIDEVDEEISKEAVQSVPSTVESPVIMESIKELNKLKKENAFLKLKLESANDDFESAKKENLELVEKIKSYNKVLDENKYLKIDIMKFNEACESENSKVEELNTSIESLNGQVTLLSKQNEELNLKLKDYEKIINMQNAIPSVAPSKEVPVVEEVKVSEPVVKAEPTVNVKPVLATPIPFQAPVTPVVPATVTTVQSENVVSSPIERPKLSSASLVFANGYASDTAKPVVITSSSTPVVETVVKPQAVPTTPIVEKRENIEVKNNPGNKSELLKGMLNNVFGNKK